MDKGLLSRLWSVSEMFITLEPHGIFDDVSISGTTAKSCQRKFVPSSHPGPFAVVATSRKAKQRWVLTLVLTDCKRMG